MARTGSMVAGLILLGALTVAAVIAAVLRDSSWRGLLTTTIRRSERGHPRWELLAQ